MCNCVREKFCQTLSERKTRGYHFKTMASTSEGSINIFCLNSNDGIVGIDNYGGLEGITATTNNWYYLL